MISDPLDTPEFEAWIQDLEHNRSVIYVLDRNFRILSCNQAWDDFAKQNEGHALIRPSILGQDLLQVISTPLRSFYETVFRHVLEGQEPFGLEYECSSPDLYRVFHMRILPVRSGGRMLVVNSLAVERPHGLDRPAQPADLALYADEHGFLHMCSHCRRTRFADGSRWDWVPSYLNRAPAPVSHGLCPPCMAYFYPQQWMKLRHRIQLR